MCISSAELRSSKRKIVVFNMISDSLVKTMCFRNPQYLGDPLINITIANWYQPSELLLLDISNRYGRSPCSLEYLTKFPLYANVPIGIGGALDTEKSRILLRAGYDKIIVGKESEKFVDVEVLSRIFGSQAISFCLDYEFLPQQKLFLLNDRAMDLAGAIKFLNELAHSGIGELVFNDINLDGTRKGLQINCELIEPLEDLCIPVTWIGGAKNHLDIELNFLRHGVDAIGIGAAYCFKDGTHQILPHWR